MLEQGVETQVKYMFLFTSFQKWILKSALRLISFGVSLSNGDETWKKNEFQDKVLHIYQHTKKSTKIALCNTFIYKNKNFTGSDPENMWGSVCRCEEFNSKQCDMW